MAKQKETSLFFKALKWVERVGNRLPHPFFMFLSMAVLVLVLSYLLKGLSVTYVMAGSGGSEAKEVTASVVNLLSADYIKKSMINFVNTYKNFSPLGLIMVMMLSIGFAQDTGLFDAVLRKTLMSAPVYMVTFVLWLYLDTAYYGFGHKIITPLTGSMWIVGAVFALLLPSQREEIIRHTKWFILGYLGILFIYRYVIIAVSGVSADNLTAAFNQAVAASSATAVIGWLQNLLWIIAITYPIAYFIFQAKKIPQFFGTRSKRRAIRDIRDIRDNTKPY